MGSCLSSDSRSPHPGSPASAIRKRKSSKKKSGSRNSSFDYHKEELLHRIPGRIFLNGSNQDAMIVWENAYDHGCSGRSSRS